MPERRASVFVCDDVWVSLNGKFNVLGMYTGDIAISGREAHSPQLVFVFQIECDFTDPYRSLIAQVTLPGEEPRQMTIPITPTPQGRKHWTIRWPFLVTLPTLRPGRIEAKVIHEKGELIAGDQWIVEIPSPQVSVSPIATH